MSPMPVLNLLTLYTTFNTRYLCIFINYFSEYCYCYYYNKITKVSKFFYYIFYIYYNCVCVCEGKGGWEKRRERLNLTHALLILHPTNLHTLHCWTVIQV
jgi:hypothetical protein